jgi:hypothetical protein
MKKSTIGLIVAAIVCLGLSVASAKYSVIRTENAISDIGDVSYTDECMEKMERALSYYNALDTNLGLDEKISNTDEFTEKKVEYVRLTIKAAIVANERKDAEGYSSADIQEFITEARDTIDAYLTTEECDLVENYSDFTALESEYADGGGADEDEGEAPPMC